MALIECYECGKTISDRAVACPHCGAPKLRHEVYSDGTECWYDANGKMAHGKLPDGSERWYDEDGKMTHEKLSNGCVFCFDQYYEDGSPMHAKAPDGSEGWLDANGKVIHTKQPDGYECWYDEDGKMTHVKAPDGTEKWYDQYYENGEPMHAKLSDGSEGWYDADGKVTHAKAPDGTEKWYDQYYENGKPMHAKLSDGSEGWLDANGKVIHTKQPDGYECWYDEDGNKEETKFSVAANKKVHFAKGNLWYGKIEGATTATFNFENDQYSFQNVYDSTWENNNHISHFYWSKDASVAYEKSYSDDGANTGDIFFTNDSTDAETANPNFTVNGEKGKYRTLSKDEWKYLIETRSVNGGTGEGYSYQRARINSDDTGVYGMIIYPDNYTAQQDKDSYTSAEWSAMESAGCVFLPAAGSRFGSSVNFAGSGGYFWSSTAYDSYYANCLYFSSGDARVGNSGRGGGRSVRLVCDE